MINYQHVVHAFGCKRETVRVCLACGTSVCACQGTARSTCPVCYRGYLAGYSGVGNNQCGYAGCANLAVATSPRVGRACYAHAVLRGGYVGADPARVLGYRHTGRPHPGVIESLVAFVAGRDYSRAADLALELCG